MRRVHRGFGIALVAIALGGSGADPAPARVLGGVDVPLILFASDRDGDWELYAADPDGSGIERITDNEVDDFGLMPSPDGTRLAYQSGDELVLSERDGSGLVRLGGSRIAGWSPDGTKLAVDGENGVLVYDPAGALVTTVPCDLCTPAWAPWAPDGRLALFDDAEPVLVDLSTGARTRLPAEPIAWSPDGARLAAVRNGSLLTVRPDGSGRQTLALDVDFTAEASWSPDGSRIAYSTGTEIGATEIFIYAGDGSRRQLTTSLVGERASSPRWSPDGRSVAFLRGRYATDPYGNRDVWVVDLDVGLPTPVTAAFPDGGDNHSPVWVTGSAPPPRPSSPPLRLQPRATWSGAGVGAVDSDGDTLAFTAIAPGHGCGPIRLWRAFSGRTLSVPRPCSSSEEAWGREVSRVILERRRLGWLYRFVDRGEGVDCLVVLRVSPVLDSAPPFGPPDSRGCTSWDYERGPRAFDAVDNGGDRYEGDTLESLEGAGRLLVYTSRHHCPYKPACDRPASGPGTARLLRVDGSGPVRIASGALASHPLDVNAGRILLLAPDGDLLLMDRRGRLGARFGFAPDLVEDAMLTGSTLVAVTRRELTVLDTASGERLAVWPIGADTGPAPQLEDLEAGIAVYSSGVALHLLRLADGRDVVLSIDRQGGPSHARLEPAGLFYSYNETHSRRPGRVAFVPFRDLELALEQAAG